MPAMVGKYMEIMNKDYRFDHSYDGVAKHIRGIIREMGWKMVRPIIIKKKPKYDEEEEEEEEEEDEEEEEEHSSRPPRRKKARK